MNQKLKAIFSKNKTIHLLWDWLKKNSVACIVVTAAAVFTSIALLIIVNAALMKIPVRFVDKNAYARTVPAVKDASENVSAGYGIITERNLFRAKLEVELPKPKTEQEIEEELLT